jgi:hypothetical protein
MKRKRRNSDPLNGEDRSAFPRAFRELGPTDADRDPAAIERGVERLQARLANPHMRGESEARAEALADAYFDRSALRTNRRVWMASAAAVAIAILVGGIYFASRPPETLVRSLRGEGVAVRAGDEIPLAQGDAIHSADLLELKSGARVEFEAGAGLQIALEGPAILRVVTSSAGDSPVHEFFVARGVITARGEPGRPRSVVWRTQFNEYRLKGTVAQLNVQTHGETLRVAEGAVFVASAAPDAPPAERLVNAGQAIVTPIVDDRPGQPVIRALEPMERAALEAADEAGEPRPADPPRFKTEDEIRQHYGFLHSLRLKSGRAYRGAIVDLDRAQIRFETVDGVFVFTRDEVEGWDDI